VPNTIATAAVLAKRTGRQSDGNIPSGRGELIDTGQAQLRVYRAGTTGPTVVICTGAGDCASSWTPVTSKLAAQCRVMSYDRPGLGGSPAGPAARSLERYLHELGAVLAHVREGQPVVLVGHSLGGVIARRYTELQPEHVAGLVLVDTTPYDIADEPGARLGFLVAGLLGAILKLPARFGLVRALLAARAMPLYPEQRHYRAAAPATAYRQWISDVCRSFAGAAGQELRSVITAARAAGHQAESPTALCDVPIAVLTSRAYGRRWIDMHRELANATGARTHQIINDRSHNIHLRHPELIAITTRDLTTEAPHSTTSELTDADHRVQPLPDPIRYAQSGTSPDASGSRRDPLPPRGSPSSASLRGSHPSSASDPCSQTGSPHSE
jgi:pimeloyl-ACP methyl ester carboxylesterase